VTVNERLDQHDRQIAAIRNLVQEGMRLVIETRKDIRALVAIQKRTEQKLETLVNTLRRGNNGHTKRKVDLQ
jgi:S-adenosylmethionine:tRNA-ribosyltransferase-isomerase (queuine synthetase)